MTKLGIIKLRFARWLWSEEHQRVLELVSGQIAAMRLLETKIEALHPSIRLLANEIRDLRDRVSILQNAQHVRLDWAKELTKTVDVLGTPSYAERTEKAKKKPRFKLMKAT